MKQRKVMFSFLFLFAFLLVGCVNKDFVGKEVELGKEQDDSTYYIEKKNPEAAGEVVLNPALNYVDTSSLMRLKASTGEMSKKRTTYAEAAEDWDFVLIDSRRADFFDRGHINGAISIPDEDFAESALLPDNKGAQLIFYGEGLDSELPGRSAEKAIALGYQNVRVYQEGITAWKEADNYLAVTGDYMKQHMMETSVVNEVMAQAVTIDARSYVAYFEAHIPNAIHMDDKSFEKKFSGVLPQNKSTEIITYCEGFACEKSHIIAKRLIKEGYKNVKIYVGGMADWNRLGNPTFGTKGDASGFDVSAGMVDRALKPAEWNEKLQAGQATILDVRRNDEVAGGRIKGSLHIPHTEILANPEGILDRLPEDKESLILIHCKAGVRSASVVNQVAGLGYNNTYFLDYGSSIDRDGNITYDIVRPLTPEQFEEKRAENAAVLDVRRKDEVATGHMKGAIHIPYTEILADPTVVKGKLPDDKNATIIIYCKTGFRSSSVVDSIVGQGYNNTYFLDGKVTFTPDGEHAYE